MLKIVKFTDVYMTGVMHYTPFEQRNNNKIAFVGILSQIKLLFQPLVSQLVWYVSKTIIHLSVSESGGYLPPLQ